MVESRGQILCKMTFRLSSEWGWIGGEAKI